MMSVCSNVLRQSRDSVQVEKAEAKIIPDADDPQSL